MEPLNLYVTKAKAEKRYTFGPLYAPDRVDAHGDFVDAETLQKGVWDYVRECVRKGDNRINLQHDDSGKATVGEWVEVCAWPYESTIKVRVPGEKERELVMPTGTVYMGVVWDEAAWENGIKKGKLAGYSLGGRAVRVQQATVDLPSMGDQHAARKALNAGFAAGEPDLEDPRVASVIKALADEYDRLLWDALRRGEPPPRTPRAGR